MPLNSPSTGHSPCTHTVQQPSTQKSGYDTDKKNASPVAWNGYTQVCWVAAGLMLVQLHNRLAPSCSLANASRYCVYLLPAAVYLTRRYQSSGNIQQFSIYKEANFFYLVNQGQKGALLAYIVTWLEHPGNIRFNRDKLVKAASHYNQKEDPGSRAFIPIIHFFLKQGWKTVPTTGSESFSSNSTAFKAPKSIKPFQFDAALYEDTKNIPVNEIHAKDALLCFGITPTNPLAIVPLAVISKDNNGDYLYFNPLMLRTGQNLPCYEA